MIPKKEMVPLVDGKRITTHEDIKKYLPPIDIFIQDDGSLLCVYSCDLE
jgi:hypothetical protein